VSPRDGPELGLSRLRVNLRDPCASAILEAQQMRTLRGTPPAALLSSSGLGEDKMRGLGEGRGRGTARMGS